MVICRFNFQDEVSYWRSIVTIAVKCIISELRHATDGQIETLLKPPPPCTITRGHNNIKRPAKLLLPVKDEQGITFHQRHYRSYRGRVFTGQMTQTTVSKY